MVYLVVVCPLVSLVLLGLVVLVLALFLCLGREAQKWLSAVRSIASTTQTAPVVSVRSRSLGMAGALISSLVGRPLSVVALLDLCLPHHRLHQG